MASVLCAERDRLNRYTASASNTASIVRIQMSASGSKSSFRIRFHGKVIFYNGVKRDCTLPPNYSSTGTCVTSSSSAASSTTSSQYIPDSSSRSHHFNLTANGRHTHVQHGGAGATGASQFNDCASTVSSCSR